MADAPGLTRPPLGALPGYRGAPASTRRRCAAASLEHLFAEEDGRVEALTRCELRALPRHLEAARHVARHSICSWCWPSRRAFANGSTRCSRGAPINATEGRAVLHTALRAPRGERVRSAPRRRRQVHAVLDAHARRSPRRCAAAMRGASGEPSPTSSTSASAAATSGPQMAVLALDAVRASGPALPLRLERRRHDIAPVLRATSIPRDAVHRRQQDLHDAGDARQRRSRARLVRWRTGGTRIARAFRRRDDQRRAARRASASPAHFGFWDWVGGRYSLLVGDRPAVIASRSAPSASASCSPARTRWTSTSRRRRSREPADAARPASTSGTATSTASRAAASRPTRQGCARLPAYLQQLEMECNGKRVDARRRAARRTRPARSSGASRAPTAQHAYFQMLHQGTTSSRWSSSASREPLHEPRPPSRPAARELLAQAQALAIGAQRRGAARERRATRASLPHRIFPGNRPSTTLLLDGPLTPRSLGALIALYEHRVFTAGALWGIDSFDQWGVELGKALATRVADDLVGRRAAGGRRPRPRRRSRCCAARARRAAGQSELPRRLRRRVQRE